MVSTSVIVIGFLAVLVWAFKGQWPSTPIPEISLRDQQTETDGALKAAGLVVSSYNDVLETKAPGTVVDEDLLPYPKSTIKAAIRLVLAETSDPAQRDHLRGAYLFLSEFQPGAPADTGMSPFAGPDGGRRAAQSFPGDAEVGKRSAVEMKQLADELNTAGSRP